RRWLEVPARRTRLPKKRIQGFTASPVIIVIYDYNFKPTQPKMVSKGGCPWGTETNVAELLASQEFVFAEFASLNEGVPIETETNRQTRITASRWKVAPAPA